MAFPVRGVFSGSDVTGFSEFLATDVMELERAVGTDNVLGIGIDGDTNEFTRLALRADGRFLWSSGAAAADVNLYRSAANVLRTDDAFIAGGNIDSEGTVGALNLSSDRTGSSSGAVPFITMSTSASSLEWRFAFDLTGSIPANTVYFRSGGTARDVIFANFDTPVLTIQTSSSSGGIVTAGIVTIGGDLDHNGTGVGFYGTAPIAQPTVTGSRGGNAALADLLTELENLGLIVDSSTA